MDRHGTGHGTGFRNLYAIPLKQTKTELSDFVSAPFIPAQGRLYALADGMRTDRSPDDDALARTQFDAFVAANRVADDASALAPDLAPLTQ